MCLGSLSNLTSALLIELGLGLEEPNKPFIWVVRGGKELEQLEGQFVKDGFEEITDKNKRVCDTWLGITATDTVTSGDWGILNTLCLEWHIRTDVERASDGDVASIR